MGTTEKNLAKLNTSTEYNTWLVKRDSLIFVKKELPLSQYDTMKTFYSLQEKTPSPFIVKIYNVFATETLCIIEEEWLSGTTIAEYLDKNLPFSSDETRQYGIEICQALRWIHKNRMVYRDLKPSNVIITNSGHAVLIDPGTIRMYKAIQSKDTVIIGTPGYAAPELSPLELGADIVVNSTSKYVNGNSDAISGVITDSGNFKWDKERYPGMKEYAKFGKFAFTAKLRNGLFRNTGACMAPQTAFYNMLGLETLGLRMERACFNAEKLAEFLTQYPDIKVNYPALPDSPWHETAEKTLEHGYGAILTIRVGSKERAFQIMNDLKLPKIVSNIGDTKSLIIHPESTLNAHSTEKEKEDAGVFDDLIRISVGIEDIQDIIEDFKYAIEKK